MARIGSGDQNGSPEPQGTGYSTPPPQTIRCSVEYIDAITKRVCPMENIIIHEMETCAKDIPE